MSGLVDIDALEALLIEAARARRSMTYAEVLAHFGIRITPRRVFALCRDLGEVCARNRARGEPEVAVLVVRKADRLPGEGFFHGYWRDGVYDGPCTGPAAAGLHPRRDRAGFRVLCRATRAGRDRHGGRRPTCGRPRASLVKW